MTRSAHRFLLPCLALIAVGGLGACQSSRPRASAATTAACRAEVDRVYAAQNRVDLSRRDQRDTPFAANYVSGNTTSGLGAQFGRDNMETSCLNNAAGQAPADTVAKPAVPAGK